MKQKIETLIILTQVMQDDLSYLKANREFNPEVTFIVQKYYNTYQRIKSLVDEIDLEILNKIQSTSNQMKTLVSILHDTNQQIEYFYNLNNDELKNIHAELSKIYDMDSRISSLITSLQTADEEKYKGYTENAVQDLANMFKSIKVIIGLEQPYLQNSATVTQ